MQSFGIGLVSITLLATGIARSEVDMNKIPEHVRNVAIDHAIDEKNVIDLSRTKVTVSREFQQKFPKMTELMMRADLYTFKNSDYPSENYRIYMWNLGEKRWYAWSSIVDKDHSSHCKTKNMKLILENVGTLGRTRGSHPSFDVKIPLGCVGSLFLYSPLNKKNYKYAHCMDRLRVCGLENEKFIIFGVDPDGDTWLYRKTDETVYRVAPSSLGPVHYFDPHPKDESVRILENNGTLTDYVETLATEYLMWLDDPSFDTNDDFE